MKKFTNLLMIALLISMIAACKSYQSVKEFASDAPVKTIVFDLPFPSDLLYRATPDAKIIAGEKDMRTGVEIANATGEPRNEISGFEVETGKKLWQLPLTGEIVGETDKEILVYEAKTYALHFVNPADGKITRTVASAPNPLLSKNALERGMAFSNDIYLTTKALYTSVYENATDWDNRREDNSFQIGITAKNWNDNKIKWFLPPVKQIVIIENRPVIFGDKAFIINPPQSADGNQTYQIVSLETGKEIFRGQTAGKFLQLDKDLFIEKTDSFVRRFEPLTGADVWKVEGNFRYAAVSAIADQITIAAPTVEKERTILLIDKTSGKTISQFQLEDPANTPLKGCFLTFDGQTLCNFAANPQIDILRRDFDYWVAYDAAAKKILWRTELDSRRVSSLFPFANGKMRVAEGK